MDILHTCIEVTDLEATREFYEDLLGLERTRQHEARGQRNYYVAGEGPAELQFKEVDGPLPPDGLHHVAIATDDVDALVARATEEYGSTTVIEPRSLDRKPIRLGAITDPDGYTVHLIEEE